MAYSSVFVFFVGMALAMVPVLETKGAIPAVMSTAVWGDAALSAEMAWLAATLGGIVVSFIAVAIFLPFRKLLEKIPFLKRFFDVCDARVIEWLAKQTEKRRIRIAKRDEKKAINALKRNEKKAIKNTKVEENKSAKPVQKNEKQYLGEHVSQSSKYGANPPSIKNEEKSIKFGENSQKNTQKHVHNTMHSTISRKYKREKHKNEDKTKTYSWGKFWIVFIFCALPIPLSGVWTAAALCSVLRLDMPRSLLALTVANTIDSSLVALFCFTLEEYINLIMTIMMTVIVLAVVYQIIKYCINRISRGKRTQ